MKKIVKNKKLLFILPLLLAGLIFSCQHELTDIWKGKDRNGMLRLSVQR